MNTISKIKYILAILVFSITFFSCENNVEEETPIIGRDEPCDPDISFVAKIKPIIDGSCIRCHGGSQAPDLRTYAGISNNAARIKTQVVNRTMPQGGSLTNEQIELIRCWIENGALNN
ncbi:cytochrome c [Aquimarina sp. MMG016]|uniref:c-type cytochrome n=1 Tax=Aquimarina sp. MMG016 TaxID=2822690 RepID=UPI001B3A2481|nr:cytochrome c [Aquimarina sp. MMG016]MBQ4819413.1 cytochrome c [Aquimarina sp. MMG016]